MSEREFENYLTLLSSLLRLSAAQREAVSSELRDHLEERVADLVQQGVAHGDAKQQAIAEFGDAARLAGELSRISELKKRRWIMRMTTGSLAIAGLLAFGIMAFWPDKDGPALVQAQDAVQKTEPEQPDQPAATIALSADDRTAAILRGISDIEFIELSLQDVLYDISDRLGVNVLIDERALDFKGVGTDVPVTLSIRGVPTDFALEWMLRQYDLGYTIREGVVIVTTPDELKKALDVRVYDVRDLLATVSATKNPVTETPVEKPARFDSDNRVPAKLAQFGRGGGGRGAGGGGVGGFIPSPSTADGELINLITATVRKDTWTQAGGPGSIRYYHGALVVSQTQDVHREIRQVLAELSRVATLKHEPTVPVNNDKGQRRGGF